MKATGVELGVRPLMEKTPGPGWFRMGDSPVRGLGTESRSTWSDGRVLVLSDLIRAEAPDGSGEAILQWHVSVSLHGKRPTPRRLRAALLAFGMADAEEDNHHPGNARHFFKPVDPSRRVGCECKATETTVAEPDGYRWTNPTDEPCRGCELESMLGKRCSLHRAEARP